MATKSIQRMDANSQANMQQTYENSYLFPTSESDGSTAQSASVALDPSTGAVCGLVGRVGGTGDTTFRNFNDETEGKVVLVRNQTFGGLCSSSGFRVEHQ